MKTFLYTCSSITHPTNDISLLTVKPLGSDAIVFQSGQYVEAILKNGARLPLSIANVPHQNGELEFHIRHNAKHVLAAQWLDEIANAPSFVLQGPKGRCTLDRIIPGSSVIFLAGGTGYAPLRSMLQSLFERDLEIPSLYFYWGITHPEDAYDLMAIELWQKQFPKFQASLVLSDLHNYKDWKGAKGWVHEYCANQHPDLKHATVFASGPYEMIQAAYQRFMTIGLPSSHFISDMLEN